WPLATDFCNDWVSAGLQSWARIWSGRARVGVGVSLRLGLVLPGLGGCVSIGLEPCPRITNDTNAQPLDFEKVTLGVDYDGLEVGVFRQEQDLIAIAL
ncbi:MAG: hypothetical protein RL258_1283, partial [Pseudomonadota bacterium]